MNREPLSLTTLLGVLKRSIISLKNSSASSKVLIIFVVTRYLTILVYLSYTTSI